MFVNCTNHRVENWSERQLEEARKYGDIVEVPFPNVSSNLCAKEVREIAYRLVEDIVELSPKAVMCQGEFTLTYSIVNELKKRDITVVAACSERRAVESMREDGTCEKKSIFEFVQFREY